MEGPNWSAGNQGLQDIPRPWAADDQGGAPYVTAQSSTSGLQASFCTQCMVARSPYVPISMCAPLGMSPSRRWQSCVSGTGRFLRGVRARLDARRAAAAVPSRACAWGLKQARRLCKAPAHTLHACSHCTAHRRQTCQAAKGL